MRVVVKEKDMSNFIVRNLRKYNLELLQEIKDSNFLIISLLVLLTCAAGVAVVEGIYLFKI